MMIAGIEMIVVISFMLGRQSSERGAFVWLMSPSSRILLGLFER